MTEDDLPLPEPLISEGMLVFTDDQMLSYAADYHANQMRKLREAQELSEARIDAEWRKPLGGFNRHRHFAHAIADPLLARIAQTESVAECRRKERDALQARVAELEAVDAIRDEAVEWATKGVEAIIADADALRTQLAEAQRQLDAWQERFRDIYVYRPQDACVSLCFIATPTQKEPK